MKPVKITLKGKDVLKDGMYLGVVSKVMKKKDGTYILLKIDGELESDPPPMKILPPRKTNSPIFRHYGGKK